MSDKVTKQGKPSKSGRAASSRRGFLKGAVAGAAASTAVAAPAIAQGKVRWKMVTTWPKNFPGVGIAAQRIADRITAMSDGQLEIKLFAAGELVPAFEMFDAVRDGIAQCGHDAPYYWVAKHKSTPFFCTVPGGLTPVEQMGWIQHGGGQELWDELYGRFGLRAWIGGNAGMQFMGWFKNEINSLADLQGLKIRMAGLHAEVFNRMGATAVNLPGGEIMPALQSGVIDAAEWGGPWMDVAFGFYKVVTHCYGPTAHEPGAMNSFTVNLEAYEDLPKHLQEVVRYGALAEVANLLGEFNALNAVSLESMKEKYNVTPGIFPDDVLNAWFEKSAEVNAEAAQEDDLAQRIYDSWSAYRERAIALAPYADYGFMKARERAAIG